MSQQITIPGPGDTLADRYLILEELGRGSYGVVFKAHEVGDPEKLVAIKTLLPQSVLDQEVIDRFEREAQLVSRLQHANIIGVHDYGQRDNLFYMVMEFIEGRSLDDLLKHEAPVSPAYAQQLMEQVMSALEHAHERGIVHRDLKPANILLKPQDNDTEMVKVLDFGIAKAMRDENQDMKTLTQAGHVLGTPHYMSPEQISGDDIDHRADLYAMGVILYELLVGEHPFEGTSPTAVMVAHLRDDPPALPPALEHTRWGLIVREALRKQPDDRLASATQFLDLLRSQHDLIDANESNEVTALFTPPRRHTPPRTTPARRGPAFAPSMPSLEQVSEPTLMSQSPADATTQWRRIEEQPQHSNFGAEPLASASFTPPPTSSPAFGAGSPPPMRTAPPAPHFPSSSAPPMADAASTLDLSGQKKPHRTKLLFGAFAMLATLAVLFFVLARVTPARPDAPQPVTTSGVHEDDVTSANTNSDVHKDGATSADITRPSPTIDEPVLPDLDAGRPPAEDASADMTQAAEDQSTSSPDANTEANPPPRDTTPRATPTKRPQPSFVELQINSSPGDSAVHINRQLVGNTPLTYKLKQSDKTISVSVSHLGFKKETRTIKPNKNRTLTFTLDKGLMLTPP